MYSFSEGSKDMYTLLGNKGATLADMTNIGLLLLLYKLFLFRFCHIQVGL